MEVGVSQRMDIAFHRAGLLLLQPTTGASTSNFSGDRNSDFYVNCFDL